MIFNTNSNIFKLYFFPLHLKLMPISVQEEQWKKSLSERHKFEFHFSRGYARFVLSKILDLDPMLVPLIAEPKKPPLLKEGYGNISISHCNDALIIGWSKRKIGIDIESNNRSLDTNRISKYLLSKEENSYCKSNDYQTFRDKFLSIWVRKEALVKLDHGKIIRDFKDWNIDFFNNVASSQYKLKPIPVKYMRYKTWSIGIASEYPFNENVILIDFNENKNFDSIL